MKKKILLIFNFILSFLIANAQEESFYKENAVKIENLEKLNSNIYNLISNRNLYMVGEMHGTTEPASFVNGLANLMLENNQNIQIGLEIPSEDMALYISSPIDKNIYLSYFFQKKLLMAERIIRGRKLLKNLMIMLKLKFSFLTQIRMITKPKKIEM